MSVSPSPAVLCLASASPRRRELLTNIGVTLAIKPVSIDETPLRGERPEAYVVRLAREKALAGARDSALPTLGSDTAVVCEQRILGKPADQTEAAAMLRLLSGCSHEVLTAVAVTGPAGLLEVCVSTRVVMREISDAECAAYWRTGEPVDKAGGYAVQGFAAIFVERIEGSYSAVVGLPLYETATLLRQQDVPLWQTVT